MDKYPKYDGFPNAPGLSEKMGLTKATSVPKDTVGWGPWKRRWYSVCSRHGEVKADCNCCMVGSYDNVWKVWFSGLMSKLTPRLWRWWVNR